MRGSGWARCGDDSLPAQASQHHPHHTSLASYKRRLRAFIMFYAGTGDMFLPDTMFISSKLVFLPRSCHHCWNLQRLLDPSETTLFHLPRPRVLTSWGQGMWRDRPGSPHPLSLVTLSCQPCIRGGDDAQGVSISAPQFVDLVPGVRSLTACFPPSALTQVSTQPPVKGGALHQHCLTASHLSKSRHCDHCVLAVVTVHLSPHCLCCPLCARVTTECWCRDGLVAR